MTDRPTGMPNDSPEAGEEDEERNGGDEPEGSDEPEESEGGEEPGETAAEPPFAPVPAGRRAVPAPGRGALGRLRGAPAAPAPAPTPSELAVHVGDRVSAVFVLAAIGVFAFILLNGVLAGNGGLLTPVPTPTPLPSVTSSPSASPAPSGSAEPSTSPSGSGSAAPSASISASPSAEESPSTPVSPAPS